MVDHADAAASTQPSAKRWIDTPLHGCPPRLISGTGIATPALPMRWRRHAVPACERIIGRCRHRTWLEAPRGPSQNETRPAPAAPLTRLCRFHTLVRPLVPGQSAQGATGGYRFPPGTEAREIKGRKSDSQIRRPLTCHARSPSLTISQPQTLQWPTNRPRSCRLVLMLTTWRPKRLCKIMIAVLVGVERLLHCPIVQSLVGRETMVRLKDRLVATPPSGHCSHAPSYRLRAQGRRGGGATGKTHFP